MVTRPKRVQRTARRTFKAAPIEGVAEKPVESEEPEEPKKLQINVRRLEALKLGITGSGCCGLGIFNGMGQFTSEEDVFALRALISTQQPAYTYSPAFYFYPYNQLMLTVTDRQFLTMPNLKGWLEKAGFVQAVEFPSKHSGDYKIHVYFAPPLKPDEFEIVIPDIGQKKAKPTVDAQEAFY